MNVHSLLKKNWKIKTPYSERTLLKRISANRKVDPENDLEEFHSPWLLKDMEKAVGRISSAIKNGERIMIFGDYDVDGVSGASILYLGLKDLGAMVSVRLPHREKDGYGLNVRALNESQEAGVSVLITVDCGISNVKEIDYGNTIGINTIVTDHHSIPPVLPNAFAIINPKQKDCKYPEKEIVGSVVAYKLIAALFERHLTAKSYKLEAFLDLAALATVADCAPLHGENRLIVKKGLLQFANTQHRGLRKLAESFNLLPNQNSQLPTPNSQLSSYHLGFLIAPCINAAGRLEDPMIAFKMMMGDQEKAIELREMNQERQEILKNALTEAIEQVEKNHLNDPILIVWNETWQPGIIGLLAGKLCEKYYRPSICLTKNENKFVGSCRSIPEINIVEKLQTYADLFLNFGGHAQAAGLSISPENLEEFSKLMIKDIQEHIEKSPLTPHLSLDTEINMKEINLENVNSLKHLEPFGMGNPTPKFLFRNVKINQTRTVGKDNTHLQFGLQHQQEFLKGIAFQFAEHKETIRHWDTVDLACQLQKNEYRGQVSVDLQIIDIRKSL